jgi:hypothetical protein
VSWSGVALVIASICTYGYFSYTAGQAAKARADQPAEPAGAAATDADAEAPARKLD